MSSEGGCWVSAQLALMGGERERGLWHLKTLVTCLGSQGTLCPCSLLMIRVGRPWNLLLLLMGPGPFSLMHSARSNKSSSEGDTTPIQGNYCTSSERDGILFLYTLYPNSKHIVPEMKLRGLVSNFYIHVSVSDLYIPTIGPWQTDPGNI
jgi:hypothetical protein